MSYYLKLTWRRLVNIAFLLLLHIPTVQVWRWIEWEINTEDLTCLKVYDNLPKVSQ